MNNKRGSILAICIIFIFIFTLLGMFAMRLVVLQNEVSDSELYYTRTHFAALYGSEIALWRIMQFESIATGKTYSGAETGMRKFLPKDSDCFNYRDNAWYPLEGYDLNEENFRDDITGGLGGIDVKCCVYEQAPRPSDGFIPDTDPYSYDAKYGTYKFYVIETTATMYTNLSKEEGVISTATDYLYFFIAYSSGTAGSITLDGLDEVEYNGVVHHREKGLCFNKPGDKPSYTYDSYWKRWAEGTGSFSHSNYNNPHLKYFRDKYKDSYSNKQLYDKIAEVTKHYTSAPNRSIVTGKVQPVFRYFIRGRR